MITFYAGSGSPFVWKVWLALEHKGLAYDLRMLSFSAGDLAKPEFRAINPRGKVPAIVDGDFALYESAAIVEYLEEQPGPSLWPTSVRDRARARRIAAETQYLHEAIERIFEQTFFLDQGASSDLAVIEAARATAGEEVARLVPREGWAAGTLSAADYALYPFLAQLDRLQLKFPVHQTGALLGPTVRAYMHRMTALPTFDKTLPPHWRG